MIGTAVNSSGIAGEVLVERQDFGFNNLHQVFLLFDRGVVVNIHKYQPYEKNKQCQVGDPAGNSVARKEQVAEKDHGSDGGKTKPAQYRFAPVKGGKPCIEFVQPVAVIG